jgi:hypothetical protein
MRFFASILSLLFLLSCAGKLPAKAPLDPALPEGWWVETMDELNPDQVGTGARFVPEGTVIVTTSGRVVHPPLRLHKTAPRAWEIDLDGDKATVRQTAAAALMLEKKGKHVVFRQATPSESKQFDARAAAPEPPPGE